LVRSLYPRPLLPFPTRRSSDLSERARNLRDLEDLELVADLDVVVALQGQAALEALLDLADVVLEALERVELPGPDDGVVAQQAHMGATAHRALEHHAPGDVADPRDAEDLADLDQADDLLLLLRRQQSAHRRLHVIHRVVDDVVVADLDPVALGHPPRLLVGADV